MKLEVTHLFPKGLSKYTVGEQVAVWLEVSDAHQYDFELYTNLNRHHRAYPLVGAGNKLHCQVKALQSGFFTWKIRVRKKGTTEWNWLRQLDDSPVTGEIQVDPAWLNNAIVYNVFVRFFKGKVLGKDGRISPGEGGTFDDVKYHLDDIKKMGINTLYFNPIHVIGELYRKYNMLDELPAYLQPGSPYSIKDFKSIDPELTYDRDTKKHLLSDPQQEFRDLINEAHKRGIYIIMDMVFNHTAHDFVLQRIRPEWFLYKENITSLEDPYLYPEDLEKGKPWGDAAHTVSPYDHGVWWSDAAQLNWEYMIPDASNKPPKNPSLKEMWEYFKSIPKYWIRHFGVDGFRCDIAYRVPAAFWKACIAESREEAQQHKNNLAHDVVFIAEAYTNNLKELQEAGFSAVYGDYSNKLHRPIELKGYLDYMYNLSGEHFPHGSKWFIFPESHDFGRTPQKMLGEHTGDFGTALRANQSRWLLTATLPGIPLIFNGFEKIEWQPVNLFSYGAVDWERDVDLRHFIAKVNKIRLQSQALQTGSYLYLETEPPVNESSQLFAFLRESKDEQVIVVVNMDIHHQAGPTIINLPEQFDRKYTLIDLLTNKTYARSDRKLVVKLDPGDAHIFRVLLKE